MNIEETSKVIYDQDEDEELTSSLFGRNDIETDNTEEIEESKEAIPVWQDEDDEKTEINISHKRRTRKLLKSEEERNIDGVEYNKRLREFYEMRHPNAKYIKRQKTEGDNDSDEELFMRDSTSKTLDKKSTILEPNIISVQRLKDGNITKYSKCVIQSLQFHPSGQLLLTAGFDKTVRLFKIDGKKNILFNSFFFDGFPIIQSSFINNGDKIMSICKDRKNIFIYDLKEGKSENIPNIMGRNENGYRKFSVSPNYQYIAVYGSNGYIIIIDGTTYRWLKDFKMNGAVYAVTFSTDSQYLYGGGVGGDVYIWNLENNKCVKRFHDEGSMKVSCISLSSNGYCAVGSDSGIVNIYLNILENNNNNNNVNERNPKPLKTFKNLTTYVCGIKFNHDNQLMAMYSYSEKNQLKLVHIPSMTVYSNWPTKESPLEYVHDVDFSPNSGYIAIGNAKGRVLLYRLNHYSQA